MKSKRIFRMGAVMLAGAVAASEVTTLTAFAENGEILLAQDSVFGEGKQDADDGAEIEDRKGSDGMYGFAGSGEVLDLNGIYDSVSGNNGCCSTGDVGISG